MVSTEIEIKLIFKILIISRVVMRIYKYMSSNENITALTEMCIKPFLYPILRARISWFYREKSAHLQGTLKVHVQFKARSMAINTSISQG